MLHAMVYIHTHDTHTYTHTHTHTHTHTTHHLCDDIQDGSIGMLHAMAYTPRERERAIVVVVVVAAGIHEPFSHTHHNNF